MNARDESNARDLHGMRRSARSVAAVTGHALDSLLALLVLLALALLGGIGGATLLGPARVAAAAEVGAAETPIAVHARLVAEIEQSLVEGTTRPGLELAEQALVLARQIGDPARIGATLSLRARLLASRGDVAAARAAFDEAAKALVGFPELAAANRLNQANLAARAGDFEAARKAYRALSDDARERGDDALAARALANAWRARVEGDPATLPRRELAIAMKALDGALAPELRATLAIHLARSLELARASEAGRGPEWIREANALLVRALAEADAAKSAGLRAEALGALGSLYESQGHLEEAASLTDRALAQARRSETPAPGVRWQLQAGRLRRALGEFDAALAHYAEAVDRVGRPRVATSAAPVSGRSGARSRFESEDAEAYRGYVDLLLRRAAGQGDPVKRKADLRQAQTVLETYRVAELRDYFADDCVDRGRGLRARVDDAPGRFVVLYPVILEDRLELLISRRDWIESRRVPIGREALEKLAREYRGLLEDRTTRLYLRPAQALYAALIAPIADLLEEQAPETIVVVPDGVLRTIPFAALHDGKKHLIERYALATTPSLELSDPHPFDRSEVGSLYGGLTTAVQGFDALPQVKQELETANRYLPGTILLDDSFSREALIGELSTHDFELVHVASHAEFSSADKGGFLLTHDGKLRLDEFRQAVELLQFRKRPLELLILSACETAAGDDRAALGFSGAAVQAGARSVLGSLWLVQDEATSILLETFYEGLANPSLSRARAMQRAQRRLIEDPAYAHPSSWAAFLLINSWL